MIAVSSLSPPDAITITSDSTNSQVEVLHGWRTTTFSVLGVNDLTEEGLWFDPSQYSTFNPDHLMHWQSGTAGNDVIALPDTPTVIFAGAGDDNVTGGDSGSEFVDLGAGNDTYVGGESFSWVNGGQGDDHITVHMVPGLDYPDAGPEGESGYGELGNNIPAVNGGAGIDVIHVTAPSPTGQPVDWLTGLEVYGGAGDDLITSDPGTYQSSWGDFCILHGGPGPDTLIGGGDANFDLRDPGGAADADFAYITIAPDPVGHIDAPEVRLDAADHVSLTIDPAIAGPITTQFQGRIDAEYGRVIPAQTSVFAGDQLVAVLFDGTETEIDVATDPRFTILRI